MLSLMRREGESIKLTSRNKQVDLLIKNTNDGKLLEIDLPNHGINAYLEPYDTMPIIVGDDTVYLSIQTIGSKQVSLGFEAPASTRIMRAELV